MNSEQRQLYRVMLGMSKNRLKEIALQISYPTQNIDTNKQAAVRDMIIGGCSGCGKEPMRANSEDCFSETEHDVEVVTTFVPQAHSYKKRLKVKYANPT